MFTKVGTIFPLKNQLKQLGRTRLLCCNLLLCYNFLQADLKLHNGGIPLPGCKHDSSQIRSGFLVVCSVCGSLQFSSAVYTLKSFLNVVVLLVKHFAAL